MYVCVVDADVPKVVAVGRIESECLRLVWLQVLAESRIYSRCTYAYSVVLDIDVHSCCGLRSVVTFLYLGFGTMIAGFEYGLDGGVVVKRGINLAV